MNNQELQLKVESMDKKLDALLQYVHQQKMSTNTVEDLVSDLSIIGTDVYHTAVEELDKRKVELDPDQMVELGVAFLRNIKNFNSILATLESTMDLLNDVSPILNEFIIDSTKKIGELEEKGYFEFAKQGINIVDNVVTGFEPEDVKLLADNIVSILEMVKDLTQPKMMSSLNNAVKVFSNIETEDIPEISVWKLMRMMNKPELKKGIGFVMTFMENISKQQNNENNKS